MTFRPEPSPLRREIEALREANAVSERELEIAAAAPGGAALSMEDLNETERSAATSAAKADGISLRGKCPAVFTSTKMTPEERFSQCPCPRKPGHEGPYAPAHTGVPSQEIRAKWSRTQGPGALSKRIDWSEAVRRFGL